MSASASLICKILAVFLLFCMSKASGGTCLSYGHSCWGGHGKRNNGAHLINPTSQKFTSGWYISRLLNPPPGNLKNLAPVFKNQDAEEVDNFRKYGYQVYSSTDAQKNTPRSEAEDVEMKPNKWNSDPNVSDDEVVVLTPDIPSMPISKFRLLQMMNQEEGKGRTEK